MYEIHFSDKHLLQVGNTSAYNETHVDDNLDNVKLIE